MLTAAQLRDDFHYFYKAELPAFQSLVHSLPPNPLVINIGAGAGTSGLAIIEARDDAAMITIDIQDESSPFGCLAAERDVIARAGMAYKWGRQWRQVKGDSFEIGMNWGDVLRSLSDDTRDQGIERFLVAPAMVYIDGDHSYEHAKNDIEIWMQILAPDGILAVHDYNKHELAVEADGPHPKAWEGVNKAVDELLIGKYKFISRTHSLIAFQKSRP